MENKLQKLYTRLCACAVFRGVLAHPVFLLFKEYCEAETAIEKLNAYAAFAAEIYENGENLTEHVKTLVFSDENVYIRSAAKSEKISKCPKRNWRCKRKRLRSAKGTVRRAAQNNLLIVYYNDLQVGYSGQFTQTPIPCI